MQYAEEQHDRPRAMAAGEKGHQITLHSLFRTQSVGDLADP